MGTFVSILLAIATFGVIIFVHELGHFLAAKWAGVRVNEFAVGMGPTFFSFGKKETKYSLRVFPIGGFCSMEGEDDESEDSRSFRKQPIWKRAIILVAGVFMNLLLGFIIAVIITMMSGGIATTVIYDFADTATSNSMLQPGDEIVKINGSRMHIDMDIVFALQMDDDGFVNFEVIRDGRRIKLEAVPFVTEAIEGSEQLSLAIDFSVEGREKTFFSVIKQSFYFAIAIVRMVWVSLFQLITGQYGLNELSGPVGVTSALGASFAQGLRTFLIMVCMITVNVGAVNILPFPALDGGRLIFLIIEGIRSKPVDPKYEGYINAAGLVLLLLLMVVVTFNDIGRLIS